MLLPIRRLAHVAVLTTAAATPYVASETEWGQTASQSISGTIGRQTGSWWPSNWFGGTEAAVVGGQTNPLHSDRYPVHAHHQVETLRPVASTQYRYDTQMAQKLGALPAEPQAMPSLVGQNVQDLREVLRFDLKTSDVLARFSRVSTVLAELSLEGLRVPIVTGTQTDDLAGTLTYYFDRAGMIQRINLHGFTGNPERLRELLATHYGLQTEPTLEAGVLTKRWNGVPVHFLRMTHAPVVYSDAVHQKFTVFLELNQPNLAYGISEEAKRIVATDQWTGRWGW
ncbi:MAG: DUF6690 family protein [Planctomycetota bacterium]